MMKFVLKHWLTILVASPLLVMLLMSLDSEALDFKGSIELYLITFLFSILFSIPTYIFMFSVAYFLDKEDRTTIQKKIILATISLLGIIISFQVFIGDTANYFSLAYVIVSLLATLIFKGSNQNHSK